MKLSILMPVFNEVATVQAAVKRVLDVPFLCDSELIVLDDGSTDGTAAVLAGLSEPRLRIEAHKHNQGKGAAIRTAAGTATGSHVVICDADLEYAPEELPGLLAHVLAGDSDVVFGTRTFSSNTAFSFWYVMGNKGVTLAANVLFNSYISDLETCFKLMPLRLYRELDITSNGFGMEAEITAKLLARGIRIFEVPISYRSRVREQGKKLTSRDGVEALWILVRVRLMTLRGRG